MAQEPFISHRARRMLRQAEDALKAGNFAELRGLAERCVENAPHLEDSWMLLAEAFAELGLNSQGLEWMDRGLALFPGNSHLLIQRCKFLMGLGERQQCLEQLRQIIAREDLDLWSLSLSGMLLSMLDEVAPARPLYRKICDLEPDNAQNWLELALVERSLGQLDPARSHLEQALTLRPRFPRALWCLGSVRTATEADNLADRLTGLLSDSSMAAMDRAYLGYALGKEYEDLGRWDEAYDALVAAGSARRQLVPYDEHQTIELIDRLIEVHDEAFVSAETAGDDSEEPIFIVGMPRTGTTLVEQLLAGHNEVFAAGELRQFELALDQLLSITPGSVPRVEKIVRSRELDFAELGRRYIESTRPRTGQTPHFTDKLPLNFLFLGMIARALPQAKIIHVQRNAMDTCWSNFKVLFGDLYEYSYDLQETARYYVQYARLMRHWNHVLPGRMCDVRYEDLVQNPEQETRRMLEFCGLEWQEACLAPHLKQEAVTTASSVQVRSPIYQSALGHWRHYEHRLDEVKAILDEAGIAH